MVNKNKLNKTGHAYKCGGIPMYPAEYKFDMEPPEGYSKEEEEARKKRLNKFLEKYGL